MSFQRQCDRRSCLYNHCYTRPPSMTLMEYAEDLHPKTCNVANVLNGSPQDDIFDEGLPSLTCHSLRMYWSSSPQDDFMDSASEAKALSVIRKRSTKPSHTENQNKIARQFDRQNRHIKTAKLVRTGSTALSTRSSYRELKSSLVLANNAPASSFTKADAPPLILTLPSLATSACEICYGLPYPTLGCQLLPRKALANVATVREKHQRSKNYSYRQ